MSKNKSVTINFGGLTAGLLGIAFVVLKLCSVIDWSWWWVTLPFWGGLAFVLAVLLVAALFYGIAWGINRATSRSIRRGR